MSIHVLKRGLGIVLAAAAMAVALPGGSAHASTYCWYLGDRYEVGDHIVSPNHIQYVCIGTYWQYVRWIP